MKKAFWIVILAVMGFMGNGLASAQDPLEYVKQLRREVQQRADSQARQAVQLYRQETGDYSTSDQAVFDYLVAESRRQNPAWYADLKQREANFQQQQAAYSQNINSIMDNRFNSYMQRSNDQHRAHQNYVRNVIWERELYQGSNGSVYELPYYSGNNVYQASDGSTFWQNQSGQYYQYDNSGWGYPMSPFGW